MVAPKHLEALSTECGRNEFTGTCYFGTHIDRRLTRESTPRTQLVVGPYLAGECNNWQRVDV
jgi:hypothetical protein